MRQHCPPFFRCQESSSYRENGVYDNDDIVDDNMMMTLTMRNRFHEREVRLLAESDKSI